MTMPDQRPVSTEDRHRHHSGPAPRPPRYVSWVIAGLLVSGVVAAVLVVTARPTAPAGSTTGVTTVAGGGPTGARIHNTDPLEVGECAEIVPLSRDDVELYRADCDSATFALDSVQLQCPDRGKVITRDSAVGWCFRWLVRSGDCLDTARNAKVPCSIALHPASVPRSYLKILTVITGAFDGAQCPNPERFLRTGRDDHRGIACYEVVESPSYPSTHRPTAVPTNLTPVHPLSIWDRRRVSISGAVTSMHTAATGYVPLNTNSSHSQVMDRVASSQSQPLGQSA